jgi:hypothetical protein
MLRRASLAMVVTILVFSTAAEGASPPAPEAGTYAAAIAITAVSGPSCPNTLGAEFAGVVDWGGIQSKTLTVRAPVAITGLYAIVSQQVLTITSGLGTTNLSGTVEWTAAGIDSPFSKLDGTFTASLVYVDAESFVANLTEDFVSIDCSEGIDVALTRVAKL